MAEEGKQKVTARQRHRLKQFVNELGAHRGRHTELVSVYVPAGYSLSSIIQHLQEEQGTASNIKSKQTRENVIAALERMIRHLQIYEKTPPNGLAVFSGNISEKEGRQEVEVWSIEPPVPMQQRLYRCDKEFVLEPLEELAEDRTAYGLLVIDKREADIALLKGKSIIPLTKSTSNVPGKTRAGGQCLHPDTLIVGQSGNVFPIRNVHNPHLLQGMKELKKATSRVLDVWSTKKNLYRIVTKYPRIELEASSDHVFFVYDKGKVKEKSLKELLPGDLLLLKEETDAGNEFFDFLPLYYNSYAISSKGRQEIRAARELKGLYQKKLAEKLGITQTAISTIELGKRAVKRELLIRILDCLEIDFARFITEKCMPADRIRPPTSLTPELAQFIGYVTGDGHIEKERITLFEQDGEVARQYRKLASEWGGNSSLSWRSSKNYYQVRIYGKALSKLLRKEFPEMRGPEKSIPDKVLRSSNRILASYLRGLFDAEGYMSSHLAIGIREKILAKQVQLAFLRFGILSSFLIYDNARNPYSDNKRYTIQISEKESLKKFKEEISFTGSRKSSKLSELIARKSEKSSVRQILADGREVRKAIEIHGYNLELFPKVNSFFRGERMMSKRAFEKSIIGCVSDKKLKEELEMFLEREFIPVKVARIEKTGLANTIDISTTTQNFLAQGLLVHNSAQRFERLREGAAKEFYRKVAEHLKESFLGNQDIKGIIIGGPGQTKNDFLEQGQVIEELKQKIIAIKDLSYTGDFGLQELLERSEDVLAEEEVIEEKQLMQKFFKLLSTQPGMVEYGQDQVMKVTKMGAVDTLLLSETLGDEVIEEFENEAQQMGTEVAIISPDTREGAQLVDLGKAAALLRYSVRMDS